MNVKMTSSTLLLSFLLCIPPLLRVSSLRLISCQLTSQNGCRNILQCPKKSLGYWGHRSSLRAPGFCSCFSRYQWKFDYCVSIFIFLFCLADHWKWVPWTDFLTPPNCSDSSDRFRGLSDGTEIGSKGGGKTFSGANISISTLWNFHR